ncbi:MAG TPA: ABC transporter permease [Actinocrinis sp.]|nr:ABC transporter permease [Actinocrinis sp.]
MIGYIIRRALQAVLTCFIVTIITFALLHMTPNGTINLLVGSRNHNNPVVVANVKARLGLDHPIVVQYLVWLGDMFKGNLGYDYIKNQPVTQLLEGTLGQTIFIVGLALVITIALAVPIGVLQAVKRNTWIDHAFTSFSFVAYSVPTFFIGWLLLTYFEDDLAWIPAGNQISSFHDAWSQPSQLILPVGTLVITTLANYTRYMRSAMLDQITQDYVRTATAKGASRRRVLYGHVLRNALIPMTTLIGLSLPGLVSGSLIIESVYNINGIGLLSTTAAQTGDTGIILSSTLLLAVITVIGSLVADISYAVLDPRVRLDS